MNKKNTILIILAVIAIASLTAILVFSQKPAATNIENKDTSQQFNKDSQSAIAAYPILVDLPKDMSPLFRIDYGVSNKYPKDSKKIALYISSDNPSDKLSAIKYIYEMGYDPSDYEIIFEGLQ